MRNAVLGLVLAAALLQPAFAADRPWTAATSEHFTVFSDDSAKTARDIAWQFEQVRTAIQTFWPWARTDLDRPVLVLAARNEDRMKTLAPQYWEQKGGIRPGSVAATGADRYYIALRSDVKADDRQGSVNPYLSAYWSYAAITLGNGFRRELPLWFVRGLAGFMSNTLVRDSSLQIGRVVPAYLSRLQTGGRLPLRELLAVDKTSGWYTNGDRLEQFDAESWAFVHFLMLGDEGVRRPKLDRFAALISEGQPPAGAAETAFGRLDALEGAFKIYFTKSIFQYMVFKVDAAIKPDAFDSRTVSAADAADAQAALLLAMGRPAEARAAIEEARKSDAKAPGSYECEGILLERERKTNEARAAYASAIERHSTNAYVYYRWSALTWGPQIDAATRTQVDAALDRATNLNDRFAPAYALSAFVKGQIGHEDEAVKLASRAVMLNPGSAQYRVTLAAALLRVSRRDEARAEANAAIQLATTDAEHQSAQRILDAAARIAGPGPAAR